MNEILESLYGRKSVRVFEQKEIAANEKTAIIRAAIEAPTAGNQSLYTMLDITEQSIKEKLSVLCDNQPFIAKASLVIVFLADCRRWFDSYCFAGLDVRKPSEGDLFLAIADAIIAAQNTVVAAESLGIGSCYIGDILEHEEHIRELLCLDDYVFPAAMLVYGYPTQTQKDRIKPKRFEEQYLVQENTYRRMTKDEHIQMLEKRGDLDKSLGFDEYISKFCQRKYTADFSLEMQRSAKRYLRRISI